MIIVPTDIVSHPYPSISALPERVSIRFDRRTGVAETLESVLEPLRVLLAGIDPEAFRLRVSDGPVATYTGETIVARRFLAAWSQAEESDLVRAAARSLNQLGETVEIGHYAFCTNGSESAGRRNIPTVGFGPGDASNAHIIDEYVPIDQLLVAVDVYRNLAINIAGATDEAR